MAGIRNEYVEHLVKRKDPVYWRLLLAVAVIATVFSLIFALFNLFGILLFIAMTAVVYFVWLFSNVEYEYLYIDGEFSVDEVQNKTRRRKLVNVRQSDLIICGPENNDDVRYNMNGAAVMDVSGGCDQSRRYVYIFTGRGRKVAMLFEMTEALKREIRYYTPQKFREY